MEQGLVRRCLIAVVLAHSHAVAAIRVAPLRTAQCGLHCRARPLHMQSETPERDAAADTAIAASVASGEVDLASLDFDTRLAVLATQIPDVAPTTEKDENIFPEGSDATSPLKKEFWALCAQDLRELEWPSRKQVFQTLFISQIAFVAIIVLTLVFDAVIESGVKSLLLDEPFRWPHHVPRQHDPSPRLACPPLPMRPRLSNCLLSLRPGLPLESHAPAHRI